MTQKELEAKCKQLDKDQKRIMIALIMNHGLELGEAYERLMAMGDIHAPIKEVVA